MRATIRNAVVAKVNNPSVQQKRRRWSEANFPEKARAIIAL
jgi:hypothetical protein